MTGNHPCNDGDRGIQTREKETEGGNGEERKKETMGTRQREGS